MLLGYLNSNLMLRWVSPFKRNIIIVIHKHIPRTMIVCGSNLKIVILSSLNEEIIIEQTPEYLHE